MHADELAVTDELVARLVARDLPDLAAQPVRRLAATGSTNVLFRLGSDFLLRFPRQPGGAKSLEMETEWLPRVAARLPVRVPEIVQVGNPGFGYPERWAMSRWLDGDAPSPGAGTPALARDLAEFTIALRAAPLPEAALTDPGLRSYRSRPLADIDRPVQQYLAQCRRLPELALDLDACADLWAETVSLPASSERPRWVHTDLLAENLVVRGDRLAAVLDFGGLSIGDPSVDLVVAWEVLGPDSRRAFRAHLDVDETTWLRGRGWALAVALMTFPYYWPTMPARCAARLTMARAVLADAGRTSR